ncbi:beta-galactosidase trimerization domain-containing protein [Paenibacillus sp. GCM10027628]|uniref:beta-galactosidase trimerization domain-containing protein n=1 Tax=Paenibacillus sp. GCM10027628 TaxID=3273413 RepID=UPI003628915D
MAELAMLPDNQLGLTGTFEAHEICELIHAENAKVLGLYTDSFYAGSPALTVNKLGRGQAYYMATRLKQDFLNVFYKEIVREAKVARVLNMEFQ